MSTMENKLNKMENNIIINGREIYPYPPNLNEKEKENYFFVVEYVPLLNKKPIFLYFPELNEHNKREIENILFNGLDVLILKWVTLFFIKSNDSSNNIRIFLDQKGKVSISISVHSIICTADFACEFFFDQMEKRILFSEAKRFLYFYIENQTPSFDLDFIWLNL